MSTEKHNSILKSTQIPLVALEGVGGSGKSHVIQNLTYELRKQGLNVITAKISGLGDNEKIKKLKEKNEYREELISQGVASDRIIEDKKKDKIFRLATRYQIRLLLDSLKETKSEIGILDRTPIMSWVYSRSLDSNNPYLDEILSDGIEQIKSLGISTIYYLNVSPETAYSRIIARSCILEDKPEERARDFCSRIGANLESTELIVKKSLELIFGNFGIKPKEYRRWDFIPYKVMANECNNYIEVLDLVERSCGVKHILVNAEDTVDQVVNSIVADMGSFL